MLSTWRTSTNAQRATTYTISQAGAPEAAMQGQHGPAHRRHTLAAAEPAREREHVPQHGSRDQYIRTGSAVDDQPGDGRQRAFQRVEEEDQGSPLRPEKASNVRRPWISGALGQDVDSAGSSHHDGTGKRAEQVGQGNERKGGGDPTTLRQPVLRRLELR
jgi:hypothetical protein